MSTSLYDVLPVISISLYALIPKIPTEAVADNPSPTKLPFVSWVVVTVPRDEAADIPVKVCKVTGETVSVPKLEAADRPVKVIEGFDVIFTDPTSDSADRPNPTKLAFVSWVVVMVPGLPVSAERPVRPITSAGAKAPTLDAAGIPVKVNVRLELMVSVPGGSVSAERPVRPIN